MAAHVVGHVCSLLQCLLFYVCCCLSHDESPDLHRDWLERTNNVAVRGGRGRREEEGGVISERIMSCSLFCICLC